MINNFPYTPMVPYHTHTQPVNTTTRPLSNHNPYGVVFNPNTGKSFSGNAALLHNIKKADGLDNFVAQYRTEQPVVNTLQPTMVGYRTEQSYQRTIYYPNGVVVVENNSQQCTPIYSNPYSI